MSLNIITLSQIIRYGNDNGYKFVAEKTQFESFFINIIVRYNIRYNVHKFTYELKK